jgi:hypothetical protein
MMKCVGVINVTGGWDWSTSPHNCLCMYFTSFLYSIVFRYIKQVYILDSLYYFGDYISLPI